MGTHASRIPGWRSLGTLHKGAQAQMADAQMADAQRRRAQGLVCWAACQVDAECPPPPRLLRLLLGRLRRPPAGRAGEASAEGPSRPCGPHLCWSILGGAGTLSVCPSHRRGGGSPSTLFVAWWGWGTQGTDLGQTQDCSRFSGGTRCINRGTVPLMSWGTFLGCFSQTGREVA